MSKKHRDFLNLLGDIGNIAHPSIEKIVSLRHHKKYGYWVVKKVNHQFGDLFEYECAYAEDGYLIGDKKRALFLCKKKGITKFEHANSGNSVLTIGFNEKEQKWYGWSHRAIRGFGIGSSVKKGDCAFVPKNIEEVEEQAILFWSDYNKENVTIERGVVCDGIAGFDVVFKYTEDTKNESLRGKVSSVFWPYPKEFGNGEWTAKTLDDAKHMAIDFAEGVS